MPNVILINPFEVPNAPVMGSDLDLIVIVRDTDTPFERRALTWDLNALPIPAELVVYTQKEWEKLMRERSRFTDTLSREAVWVYP